jgi:hypothetical protein
MNKNKDQKKGSCPVCGWEIPRSARGSGMSIVPAATPTFFFECKNCSVVCINPNKFFGATNKNQEIAELKEKVKKLESMVARLHK